MLPPDRDDSTGSRRLCAIPAPILHQSTALLEQIAAPVCTFDLITNGMRQSLLDDVWRIRGRLCSPGLELRPKTMNHDARALHGLEHLKHRQMTRPPLALPPTKNKTIAVFARQPLEQLDQCRCQRDAMFSPRLHPCCGQYPDRVSEIDLGPRRADGFAGSGGGEDGELQRLRAKIIEPVKLGHELWQFGMRQ